MSGCLATWWLQTTPGTNWWRCEIPARHLPGQAIHLGWSDLVEDDEGFPVVPRQKGASIWPFAGNASRGLIMANLQTDGVKVLLEVDDLYLKPAPHVPGLRTDWAPALDRSRNDRYSHQAHRKIAQWVDGVICSTPELANHYERATSAPIFLCPNSVDLADWGALTERKDGPVRVGFAGSPSHLHDVSLVTRALDAAFRMGAELWKIGLDNVEWRWPHTNVRWENSLPKYREHLKNLDIGLCPLKKNEWADCRSDIKAIEYVLSGAIPVVQADSPAYTDWMEVAPSASSQKDWEFTVQSLLRLDEQERKELWRDCYQFVLDNRLIEQSISTWREAVA